MNLVNICLLISTVNYASCAWYDGECGVSKYSDAGSWPNHGAKSVRIIGGIDARPNEFPWQASLRYPPANEGLYHFCGGVIIHPYWVVTAAHCTKGEQPKDIIVVVGEHDDSELTNPARASHVTIEIFEHEEYKGSSTNYDYDVALLLLEEPIEFNENVQPACEPLTSTYTDEYCQVSGWGTVEQGAPAYPTILQWTEMIVNNNTYCENKLQEISGSYYVTPNMICSSDEGDHTERDTCQGDSGGPMTVQNADGLFEIVGLTSWGYGCASSTPGVYTRVTRMRSWIQNLIDNNTPAM